MTVGILAGGLRRWRWRAGVSDRKATMAYAPYWRWGRGSLYFGADLWRAYLA